MSSSSKPVVRVRGVNHSFGAGETRSQVLFDNHLDVMPGDLVILSGPSGSGKTTLLTLIGGLRTLQEGAIDVWDDQLGRHRGLLGLDEEGLVQVRRLIGFPRILRPCSSWFRGHCGATATPLRGSSSAGCRCGRTAL